MGLGVNTYPDTVSLSTTTAGGWLETTFTIEFNVQTDGTGLYGLRLILMVDGAPVPNQSYTFTGRTHGQGAPGVTCSGTWLTPASPGAHTVGLQVEVISPSNSQTVLYLQPRRVLIAKEVRP